MNSSTRMGADAGAAAELARLEDLYALSILDSPPEREYDDLVTTAALVAGTSMAMISLIDEDRQWFKARIGLEAEETPRDVAFCHHTIQEPSAAMVVEDARLDPRFAGNPFVIDEPHIAFYAGVPIVTEEGNAVGTICVCDSEPRRLTADQIDALRGLGRQAAALLELRRRTTALAQAVADRDRLQDSMRLVTHLQDRYIAEGIGREWWNAALDGVLELSGSEYGFLGRVEQDADGAPFLITYAVTDIAWNDWSRGVYDEFAASGMEFHNLETLFGATLSSGKPVISNHPAGDPRAGGLPPGHPPLLAYLGIPVHAPEGLVGMIGLANSSGGFSEQTLADLEPITTSLSQIISRDLATRRAQELERDGGLIAEAIDAVLGSKDMETALSRVTQAVETLEPGSAVTFLSAAEHGDLSGDCRAMASGASHLSAPSGGRCAHVPEGRLAVCVPVATDEEDFGVLSVVLAAESPGEGPLAVTAAQRLLPRLESLAGGLAGLGHRERLAHRALTDPLTGLGNRAAFMQALGRALEEVDGGRPFGVIMLDLDGLKAINDTLGHQAGDRVLVEVGSRLLDVLREGDRVARLGGDEFGVLIPGADRMLLERAGERIRAAIAAIPVSAELGISASVGGAAISGPAVEAHEIYRVADGELYAAKHGGRDQVVVRPEPLG